MSLASISSGSPVEAYSTPLTAPKKSARDERGSNEGRFYKPLRKEFWHNGFNYRLIAREGYVAIYEQIWGRCSRASVSYEVVLVRRRKGIWIGSTFVEPAEIYPKSEAWGIFGFTVGDKESAFRKLREVIASRAPPKKKARPVKTAPLPVTELTERQAYRRSLFFSTHIGAPIRAKAHLLRKEASHARC